MSLPRIHMVARAVADLGVPCFVMWNMLHLATGRAMAHTNATGDVVLLPTLEVAQGAPTDVAALIVNRARKAGAL